MQLPVAFQLQLLFVLSTSRCFYHQPKSQRLAAEFLRAAMVVSKDRTCHADIQRILPLFSTPQFQNNMIFVVVTISSLLAPVLPVQSWPVD